ncbi:GLABROUS1 enhancer-binding protein family [Dillenia turbinata]|uniref:GLABROUS1 enhancer-binding protein family n=1 Tax=Dillenia turbinata TaxID=194707 RepID=A0AAN8VEJ0_9MAGN
MDSTPISNPNPNPNPSPSPSLSPDSLIAISSKPSASKLPIKRKAPSSSRNPNLNVIVPKIETSIGDDGDGDGDPDYDDGAKPPPFKFHRIWSESDEIRFLRGLLDCANEGLSFPKDLHVFYSRFSETMSQPYTKSQLSEKLRRLRKKFRVISSRLARGLSESLLSPHDRELYQLSKQLWPLLNSQLIGVKVTFSPTISFPIQSNTSDENVKIEMNKDDGSDVIKTSFDTNVDDGLEEEMPMSMPEAEAGGSCASGGIGGIVARSVLNVFDQSLKEFQISLTHQGLLYQDQEACLGREFDFEKRWREQRAAELDVFARRMRLALENSFGGRE